jgi:deferrochelatase/peroxidase EfeB
MPDSLAPLLPIADLAALEAPLQPPPIGLPDVPMDPAKNPNARDLLQRIQGNILKSHGRKFTRLVLYSFKQVDRTNRKLFAATRTGPHKMVTSAWEQYEASPTRSGLTGEGFYGLGLTVEGMRACGYSTSKEFPRELGASEFRNGVIRAADWDPFYRPGAVAVHGLWILAHESDAELVRMENRVEQLIRPWANIIGHEDGFVWRDAPGGDASRDALPPAREPFGFIDGISEPVLISDRPVAAQPWVQTDLRRVIITEGGDHFGGSFFVFSKLDQNVKAFRGIEAALRATRRLPESLGDPGALLIGRNRDGTPLATVGRHGPNDFDFDGVPSERRCPFHAHIRKANPRSNSAVVRAQNHGAPPALAQFIRRSVVYDQPPPGGAKQLPPFASPDYAAGEEITKNVGLLFMGYMRDIGEQFLTLRENWFKSPTFPDPDTTHTDPLMGTPVAPWSWPGANPAVRLPTGLPPVVTARGDLYLYVPPITWLESQ